MENLRKFNTKEEYQAWRDSDDYSYPNVCKVADEIIYNDYPEPFWVEAVEDISVNYYFQSDAKYYGYWSYDKVNWVEFNSSDVILRTGEKIYIYSNRGSSTLCVSGKYNVGGSILSLVYNLDYLTYNTHTVDFFKNLFINAKKVVNAKYLILADVLPEYKSSGLGVYANLFSECSLLQSAPKLPNVDNETNQCFKGMFSGCNSLTTAPTIKSINDNSDSCCESIFNGCSNLSFIKLMNDIPFGSTYFSDWVKGVSATGTFITVSNRVDFTRGDSGIPEGWNIYLYDEAKDRYMIKFKVNNIPYEYYTDSIQDITWNEFINSDYNTNRYTAKLDEGDTVKSIKFGDDYVLLNGSKVLVTDKVVLNASYTTGQPTQTALEEE